MTMTAAARTAVEGFRQETRLEAHTSHGPGYIVHALGRDFHVSDEMARIFLHQVERVAESDTSALVILRHAHGVELLMITDASSFSIRPMTPADRSAAQPAYPRMRG
ncbi:TetR family transcriptional regulator [Leifsonia shinshuensis]|uniref:TetR family transcriptional regulator n=1 Tax=Leifsonia shinshuensis TaxID=150026 RepID=A0A7G6YCW4_9MICO|nr:TetR family transcriptional regulator [Leifsonia shinshuensis]QNE36329.1 TetR family transcriptional regulator [Leifsonia shinshuensis]